MKLALRLAALFAFCAVLAVGCTNETNTTPTAGGATLPGGAKKDKDPGKGLVPPPLPPAPP
jgi:hypothetical protein